MPDLESTTRYDPAEVEPRIVEKWLESGLFHPDPEGTPEENYSIAIPPPNVTGVLHMGHALNNTIQDCLARYHRMRGQRTKWILGTDHAGIATQTQVERALISRGHEPRARSGGRHSWSGCGSGARSTAARSSSSSSASARRADYADGAVHAGRRLRPGGAEGVRRRCTRRATSTATATWSTGIRARARRSPTWRSSSARSRDTLYYIDYPLATGSGAITVATVRPETMLADTAIAVNPDDDRYRRLIGEKAILPLVGRKLKIIADEYVRPEFGTGALKITPAHDPNDFEIGRRHGLAQPSVIGEDGRITARGPGALPGPDRRRGPARRWSPSSASRA